MLGPDVTVKLNVVAESLMCPHSQKLSVPFLRASVPGTRLDTERVQISGRMI